MALRLDAVLGLARGRKLVLSGAMAFAGTMLVVVGFMLIEARKEAWERAEEQSTNVKAAILGDVRSQLSLYGTLLDVAAGLLGVTDLSRPSQDAVLGMLRRMAVDPEVAGVIIVLDKDGYSVVDSGGASARTDRFSDRPYFKVHRDRADVGLYVGQPYRSRLRNDDPSVALSRRVSDGKGDFAGVVVAAIRLEHIGRMFSRIDLGEDGALSLVNDEGIVLTRYPSADGRGDVGRDVSASPTFRRTSTEESGSLVAPGSLDGVERLVSFGRVTGFPLRVNVSVSTRKILAGWRRQAIAIGSISVAVSGAVVLLGFGLQRKIDELEAARAALSVVASTDDLTGLANRREFDVVIRREWQRAMRDRTPLSLLVIDADHFKLVNDQFGHAQGDEVLKGLARGIGGVLMRPADLAARYGGEEFAVLLPNTDARGAFTVAESIRIAAASSAGRTIKDGRHAVTVSVGAVSTVPDPTKKLEDFMAAADIALYQAKAQGRNRSVVAQQESGTVVPLRPKAGPASGG